MEYAYIVLALLGIFSVAAAVALAMARDTARDLLRQLKSERRQHDDTMLRAINAETELWRYKRFQTGHRMDWPELVEPQPIPPALAEQECETAADYSPRWTVHGGTA